MAGDLVGILGRIWGGGFLYLSSSSACACATQLMFIYLCPLSLSLALLLSGKFVLRFKYSTKISLPFGKAFQNCLYSVSRGSTGSTGERMKEESAETKETRSLCRLVRSLVSKMSQPKRIAIIYGFLMRRQSASQPTVRPIDQSIYDSLLSYSLYTYISYCIVCGERNSVCVFIIHGFN